MDTVNIDAVSTGADPLQCYRFGVIPQLVLVLLAQILYFLESSTRSATIIGAITDGGIGLMLTQTIQTRKNRDKGACYIMLIVVMAMDWLAARQIDRKERLMPGRSAQTPPGSPACDITDSTFGAHVDIGKDSLGDT